MRLFDGADTDAAYDKLFNPPDIHLEECGCDLCHEIHVDENYFQAGCLYCSDEYCVSCNGTGLASKDMECPHCIGGRV